MEMDMEQWAMRIGAWVWALCECDARCRYHMKFKFVDGILCMNGAHKSRYHQYDNWYSMTVLCVGWHSDPLNRRRKVCERERENRRINYEFNNPSDTVIMVYFNCAKWFVRYLYAIYRETVYICPHCWRAMRQWHVMPTNYNSNDVDDIANDKNKKCCFSPSLAIFLWTFRCIPHIEKSDAREKKRRTTFLADSTAQPQNMTDDHNRKHVYCTIVHITGTIYAIPVDDNEMGRSTLTHSYAHIAQSHESK